MKKRKRSMKIGIAVMICGCMFVLNVRTINIGIVDNWIIDNGFMNNGTMYIGAIEVAAASPENVEAPQITYSDTILSIYPEASAPEYQALGQTDVLLENGIQVVDESGYMRFVSVLDGVNVSLDYGKWYDSLDYFHVINQDLFSIYTSAGTVYSFPAYTSENAPELRIRASFGNAETSWILQKNIDEQFNVINLKGSTWKPEALTKDSNMMELCIARASLQYLYNDANAQENPWYFWQTIENAVTEQDPCGYEGIIQGDQWPMETWLVDSYIEAIFPDCEISPELPEKLGGYAPEFGQYSLNTCSFANWLTGEIGIIQKINEDTWIVGVHLTDWKENRQESYVAVLVENKEYQVWSPFEYEISGMYRFDSELVMR